MLTTEEMLRQRVQLDRPDSEPTTVRELLLGAYRWGRADQSDQMTDKAQWDPDVVTGTPRPAGGWTHAGIPLSEYREATQ